MHVLSYAFLLVVACRTALASARENFSVYGLTDVFPKLPNVALSVRYFTEEVDAGNIIPTYSAVLAPYVYYDTTATGLYTFAIVDPDVPTHEAPYDGQHLLNLIVNIPGNNLLDGDVIVQYTSPNPIPGSGFHRIVFGVYKQSRHIDINGEKIIELSRKPYNFSINNFAQRYDCGNPIAINFFRAQLVICPSVTTLKCKLYT